METMQPAGTACRQTKQGLTVGTFRYRAPAWRGCSGQRPRLVFTPLHFALATRVEPDDQVEMLPPRCHGPRGFGPHVRLGDQRIVEFNAPLVALRGLKVGLFGPAEGGLPKTLKCDHVAMLKALAYVNKLAMRRVLKKATWDARENRECKF